MENKPEALSGWQDVQDSPVGFGNGKNLLTEKKNRVQQNTEILGKLFGSTENKLDSVAYSQKVEGYSKQALTRQAWLTQNRKRQAKRLVRSTKKSSSKHSSPKHQHHHHHGGSPSPTTQERKVWQDVPIKPNAAERKARLSPTSTLRRTKSTSPRALSVASSAETSSDVSISGHFLQKMVLHAWYAETCQSIEKELFGLRAQEKRQRKFLVSCLLTWKRVTTRNARLRRLSYKYEQDNSQRLLHSSFAWWKQTLQTKLSGYYFLQKSRKYDLHRRFRAWKKASVLNVESKISYLHIMEKHLIATKKKEVLRSFWNAWRSGSDGGAGLSKAAAKDGKDGQQGDASDTASHMRELVRLWSRKSKLTEVEEKYMYTIALKAESLGMGVKVKNDQKKKSSSASTKAGRSKKKVRNKASLGPPTYKLDANGNVVRVFKEDQAASAGGEDSGDEEDSMLANKLAAIQSKQKGLAHEFKNVRSNTVDSIVSMNHFLEDLGRFFQQLPEAEAGSLESLTQEMFRFFEQQQQHQHQPSSSDAGASSSSLALVPYVTKEHSDELLTELRCEMQVVIARKDAQLVRMIDNSLRGRLLMNVWMGWVMVVLLSKQKEGVLVQQIRRVLSESKFRRLSQHLVLKSSVTRGLTLQKAFQNRKLRLLFTAWRNDALVRKIQNGRYRLAMQRVRKLQQYSVLKHWRTFVSDRMSKRKELLESLRKVCNAHLNLGNLLRAWQVSTCCAVFDKKAFKKAKEQFERNRMRKYLFSWQAEAERLASNANFLRHAVARWQGLRIHQVFFAWLDHVKYERRLKVIGQFVYTQTVKRILARHMATWCSSVMEARHNRNKQQLKKLIKQMQKMLTKSKEKIEMVESERDDASKKVGDLVTAVTNLNWKIQYGSPQYKDVELVPEAAAAAAADIMHTPVLRLTRK